MTPETNEIFGVVDCIKPLLYGHAPEIQGAILSELLALWIAGHRPDIREQVIHLHLDLVRKLVVANDQWTTQ